MAKGYSARKGFSGGAGMMQQQAQMQQKLMKMQQDMAKAQEDVENSEFTRFRRRRRGDGGRERQEAARQPDRQARGRRPRDVEMLQDLVISAVNEALRQADEAMENSMKSATGGLNIPGLF